MAGKAMGKPTQYTDAMQAGQDMLDARLGVIDEAQQKHLRECSTIPNERLELYSTAETYYDGTQKSYITDRLKEYLEASGLTYVENYCETVVDALVERLAIIGFSSGNSPLDDWLWTWWDKNRGDELQLDVHDLTAKKGDAFVILEWDQNARRVSAHVNRPEVMNPHYHEGRLVYVSKVWDTDEASPSNPTGERVKRMNLYYPDRVEKWFAIARTGTKQMWGRWLDDGDTKWPIPWVYEGKPLGIPVFHFANKPRSDHMGRPEHFGTIPQQDRLTKELLDLSAVLDQLGWPQRYVAGIDDTSGLKNVPGEVWHTPATDGTFGQFDAADPEGLLKAVQATQLRIATRSNTPTSRFTLEGGYPSGESQKMAEAGLVAKARNRQTKWGGIWAALVQMATAMSVVYGEGSADGPGVTLDDLMTLTFNPTWADPETRNEKEHLETLQLMHGLGVSTATLLTMMPGVDAAKETKLRAKEDDEAASRQAQMMDAGSVVPPKGGSNTPLSIAG
jgi:hypothetical protein